MVAALLSLHAQMPLINTHADVSSEARGLNFSLSFHLHPYNVYASKARLWGVCAYALAAL